MFDFEKFEVYQLIKDLNFKVEEILESNTQIDEQTKEQWQYSMHQAVMNLVKATSKESNTDKSDFVAMSRSNIFECAAILDMLKSKGRIEFSEYKVLYDAFEHISPMLLGMYNSYLYKTEVA